MFLPKYFLAVSKKLVSLCIIAKILNCNDACVLSLCFFNSMPLIAPNVPVLSFFPYCDWLQFVRVINEKWRSHSGDAKMESMTLNLAEFSKVVPLVCRMWRCNGCAVMSQPRAALLSPVNLDDRQRG